MSRLIFILSINIYVYTFVDQNGFILEIICIIDTITLLAKSVDFTDFNMIVIIALIYLVLYSYIPIP